MKLEGNRQRDLKDEAELVRLGWKVLVTWECQLRDRERLAARITDFLDGGGTDASA
jgi:DNA mismatch endonuclease (patch repair protein)